MLAILVIDLWILNNEFLSLTKKKNFESQFIKSTVIDHILDDDSNFKFFPADDLGSIPMDIGVSNLLVVIEL